MRQESKASGIRHYAYSAGRYALCFMSSALCLLACAKKLPPPNTDVFPPTLQDVTIVNQNRIDLAFDEPMKTAALKPGNFSIVSAGGETLGLLAVTPASDRSGVTILTRRQAHERYILQGSAQDDAGNTTRFTLRFAGSSRPDTIPPGMTGVSPRPGATKVRKQIAVKFTFSKAIDTLTYGGFMILPQVIRARCTTTWDPTLMSFSIAIADSLGRDTTVSVVLFPILRDFSGNHPIQAGFTSFTADSLVLPKQVRGRVVTGGNPPKNALVMLEQDRPELAALVRSDGSFSLRARDSTPYSAFAEADTDFDGWVDLIGRTGRAPLPETLLVPLVPETLRVRVESLF